MQARFGDFLIHDRLSDLSYKYPFDKNIEYYHIGLTLHLNPQPASSIAPFFEFVLSVQQSSAVEIVNRRVKQYVWQTYIAETFFVSPRKKLKIF